MKAKTLIIGNANYPNSVLDNPENDFTDIYIGETDNFS